MGSPRELILLNKKCQCAAGADADFDIGKKFNELYINWIQGIELLVLIFCQWTFCWKQKARPILVI